jgi:hypothetical protein
VSDQDQPGNVGDPAGPPPVTPETFDVQITDDLANVLEIRELPEEVDVRVEDTLSDEVNQFLSLRPPPAVVKEETAKWVAMGLVVIFGVLTTLALIGGFFIIKCSGCSPETAKQTITDSAIPFLKEVGAFAQTVFGPLLAFILGYYFASQKKE